VEWLVSIVNKNKLTPSNIPRVMHISCERNDDAIACMGVLEYPTNAIVDMSGENFLPGDSQLLQVENPTM
jgi:hypothetical protein